MAFEGDLTLFWAILAQAVAGLVPAAGFKGDAFEDATVAEEEEAAETVGDRGGRPADTPFGETLPSFFV